jgi:hypothetical protein
MLVELSISTWQGRKADKRVSKEVTTSKGAKDGAAAVTKRLLGDCEELQAVLKYAANARNAHYGPTMPWSDTGLRLLPTAAYFNYHEMMTGMQAEFDRLVATFIDNYEWEVAQAAASLGDMFSRDEYPTAESLRWKFKFSINYIPLPDTGDWRVDIGETGRNQLESHYQQFYQQQLGAAMTDIWQRTYEVLNRMSDRLDYSDDGTKKIFRESLVTNVVDIVSLLEMCNVTNDPAMAQKATELRRVITGISADDLRKDGALRAATKRDVDAIIRDLPGLGM